MFCKKCGTQLADDAVFCTKCGEKVDIIENNQAQHSAGKTPLPPSKKPVCPQCGAILKDGAKFCKVCGSSIDAISHNRKSVSSNSKKNKFPIWILFAVAGIIIIGVGILVYLLKFRGDPSGAMDKRNSTMTESEFNEEPEIMNQNNSKYPADPNATTKDIMGTWKGTANLVAIEGLKENADFFKQGGYSVEQVEEMYFSKSENCPVELEIRENGAWSITIEALQDIDVNQNDLLRDNLDLGENANPDIFNILLQNGYFEIDGSHHEKEGDVVLVFTGAYNEGKLAGTLDYGATFSKDSTPLVMKFEYELTDFVPLDVGEEDAAFTSGDDNYSNNDESALQQNSDSSPHLTADDTTKEDFAWFFDAMENGEIAYPQNSKKINYSSDLEGSWKGLELINDIDGSVGKRYFTMTIAGDNSSEVAGTIRYHDTYWDNGFVDKTSDLPEETLYGSYEVLLELGEPGYQITAICYELDGKQYIGGTWEVQSGESVFVALVRP